jgi:hypothetical protein
VSTLLLSIDGGGALGIGPCELLARLEEGHGRIRPDAYAGTSVGALLVALAAAGRPWAHVREIFARECPGIFEKPNLAWRLNPCKPRYDGRALRRAAQTYFQDMRLCEVESPIFLTSFDFQVGHPKVWDRGDTEYVWRAVLASAAAPTYFPIVDGRWGDGGLVANNPAMVGLAGCAAREGWDLRAARCLSLGTNGDAWRPVRVRNRSAIGWLRPLLATFLDGGEELATFEARAVLGERLLRVEPHLRHEVPMDDVEAALGPYRRLWGDLWHARRDEILLWLRRFAA